MQDVPRWAGERESRNDDLTAYVPSYGIEMQIPEVS
jgi:hypothetical protein